MIKIKIKEHKEGIYKIEKNDKHTNTMEHLVLINKLIEAIEEHGGSSFDEIINLLKEMRK